MTEQVDLKFFAFGLAWNGSLEKFKDIVEQYPEALTAPDGYGCTPLMLAASGGNVEFVEYILEKLGDKAKEHLDAQDKRGQTALIHSTYVTTDEAAMGRCKEIFDLFLQKGANPNKQDKDGNTVLHYLVGFRHDGDDEERVKEGERAKPPKEVYMLQRQGVRTDWIESLLENNADVSLPNWQKRIAAEYLGKGDKLAEKLVPAR